MHTMPHVFSFFSRQRYALFFVMAFRGYAMAGGRSLLRVPAKQPHNIFRQAAVMRTASSTSDASAEDLHHQYAVPKVDTPTLAVVGSAKRFPVRRVYCVGSNYRYDDAMSWFLER